MIIKTELKLFFLFVVVLLVTSCKAQTNSEPIIVGAERTKLYLENLQNKNIAVMVNHTSTVGNLHLVDFLLSKHVTIKTIFAPEHGFRGNAANGEEINNSIDTKTNLPIISLYGKKKKATAEDLRNIDLVIFDIQDVGCRFYTYISSMYYMMEACAENNIDFMVFDRPNPNGHYIAGPVLDMELKSFVGIIPVPIVHGCTVGELAQMINGENWLSTAPCQLTVVPIKNYDHTKEYVLPIKPSPNLPNQQAILLYPSLCFFEATHVSVGRGTEFPFQVLGYPNCPIDSFSFTPKSIEGVSKYPLHEDKTCTGIDLRSLDSIPKFTLSYFLDFYNTFEKSDKFWKSKKWIELLSGDKEFYDRVNNGWTENQFIQSWKTELERYKQIRNKYLLYTDF